MIMNGKENDQILTSEKLEAVTVWKFCFKMTKMIVSTTKNEEICASFCVSTSDIPPLSTNTIIPDRNNHQDKTGNKL